MRLRRITLVAIVPVATACSNDKELHSVVAELAELGRTVEQTLKASPNEDGLAKSEALLAAKSTALHGRIVTLHQNVDRDPDGRLAMACALNETFAKNARDHVYNAVLETNPKLRSRARKLGGELCSICTPPFSGCAGFGENDP